MFWEGRLQDSGGLTAEIAPSPFHSQVCTCVLSSFAFARKGQGASIFPLQRRGDSSPLHMVGGSRISDSDPFRRSFLFDEYRFLIQGTAG